MGPERGEPIVIVTDTIDPRAETAISGGLARFNEQQSGIRDHRSLAVVASDPETNEVLGRLTGRTSLGLGCRFQGCGVPFVQGHHVRHWAAGGPTTLSNLALLCRQHHRAVHEEGYQVDRQPDGALQFRRPDGRPLPEVPSPTGVPDDLVQGRSTSCILWPPGPLIRESPKIAIDFHDGGLNFHPHESR